MKDLIDKDDDWEESNDLSTGAVMLFISWFLFAAISFMSVVMFYYLLMGVLSLSFGYETHIHFGSVDSLPHAIKYWNDFRVVCLYALPSVILLIIGTILLVGFFLGTRTVSVWAWVKFWVMISCYLFANTMLSLSMVSVLVNKGSLFQGFSVLCYWWGTGITGKVVLFATAVIIDFAASIFTTPNLMYLAPRDFNRKKRKIHSRIILYSYFITLVLIMPIVIFLASPFYQAFFVILFIHGCIWLLGLFIGLSNEAIVKRSSRNKMEQPYSNYKLAGVAVTMIILIKIFFS